ncbi:hybrid sensor histidine kinase/response regulator, partial [Vibrio sp. 10N.222.51.A6]
MFGFTVNEVLKNDKKMNHLEVTRIKVEALQSFNAVSSGAYQWLVLSKDSPEKGPLFLELQVEVDRLAHYEIQLQQFDNSWTVEPQLIELKSVLKKLARVTTSIDSDASQITVSNA